MASNDPDISMIEDGSARDNPPSASPGGIDAQKQAQKKALRCCKLSLEKLKSCHYERTFQTLYRSYAGQSGCYFWLSIIIYGDEWLDTTFYDNNYQNIRYHSFLPSINPKQYLRESMFAGAYRIKKHGFKLKYLDSIMEQAYQNIAHAQNITTFIENIPIKIYTDCNFYFHMESILMRNHGESPFHVNRNFQVCKPRTQTEGTCMLAFCKIDLSLEWTKSIEGEPRMIPESHTILNDMNGLLTVENLHVGQEK